MLSLVLAPWAFGSRPYFWNGLLSALLFVAGALGFFGAPAQKKGGAFLRIAAVAVVFLAAYMWIGVGNSRFVFEPSRRVFEGREAFIPFLPSTVDARSSLPFAISMTAMLSTILLTATVSGGRRWRLRFLSTMAWTGISVIAGGLLLKAGLLPSVNLFLAHRPWASGDIFGPFDYHGNAGTFINLTIPAIACKAAAARPDWKRSFWLASLCLAYLAAFVNTSRAALTIALAIAPVILWMVHKGWGNPGAERAPVTRGPRLALPILVFTLVTTGTLILVGGSKAVRRMADLRGDVSVPWYPRFLQNETAWEMAQQHPLFGDGIGSYKVLVGFSKIGGTFFGPRYAPGEPYTVLSNAHDDYLQTLAEWGWIGTAGWILLVGAAGMSLWRFLRTSQPPQIEGVCVSVALAAVYLHAAVDCPLQIPALQLYTAIYLGIALGLLGAPDAATSQKVE